MTWFMPNEPEVRAAIKAHFEAEWPREACGAITPDGYRPLRNRHPDPVHFFDCADEAAPLQIAGSLLALVHSHTRGDPAPTEADMRQQIATGVPWGIAAVTGQGAEAPFFWGDTVWQDTPRPAYVGRPFRHGPTGTDGAGDCYALCRDWYLQELGIALPEWPRNENWWHDGANHYLDNFRQLGFRELGLGEPPRRGDGALFKLAADVPEHAAIFVGNEQLLHHLSHRLSSHAPIGVWRKHIVKWIRHEAG